MVRLFYRLVRGPLRTRSQTSLLGGDASKTSPKIYVLPVPPEFQPKQSPFRYPSYASDYGVEQDFLNFLRNKHPHTTQKKEDADFIYLKIFWTRYHLTYSQSSDSPSRLGEFLQTSSLSKSKVFTVCQYDDGTVVTLDGLVAFLASRANRKALTFLFWLATYQSLCLGARTGGGGLQILWGE